MNNFFSTILGAAAIVMVQPQITIAQSIDAVATIAEQITVEVEPSVGDNGSGAIVGKNNDIYYVLTARHVINYTVSGDEAYIYTYDGQSHDIDTANMEQLPHNTDLVLLQFKSDRDYPVATISQYNYQLYNNNDYDNSLFNETSSTQYVFVSGFPLGVSKRIFAPGILFDNSGTAVSYQPDGSNEDNFGGYELVYTNLTHSGMSGGAVLDSQGRLIGIHGRADGRSIGAEDEIIQDYLDEVGAPVNIKVGLSLGIPIQTFLSWAANNPIYSYLNIEDSAPPVLSQAVNNSWEIPVAIEDTNNPYHWLEKGNKLWRVGQVAEARGAYNKAIELKPDLYLAWFAKGFALGFDRKYDLALEACDKAIELQVSPSRYKYEAYRCKAGALQALQKFEPALASLKDAMSLNSSNPADWANQGELQYALGNYQDSLQSLSRAIELRKTQNLAPSALFQNNRGLVKVELEQYESALQDIESAIAIDPKYTPAWHNKGLLLKRMGRNEESLTAYDKATELEPDNYYVWTNRGVVLYQMGRNEEAKQSLEKALSINPNYQPAKNSLDVLANE